MVDEIHVQEVIEKNDCAGKKSFFLTATEDRHPVQSQFRLTPSYMPPHDKLALASVSAMDRVKVVMDHNHGDLLVVGDYVHNFEDVWNRDPICLCQTRMVSDGFDIYCTNQTCALTLTARIQRLASASFFQSEFMRQDLTEGFFERDGTAVFDDVYYCRPFVYINQGLFWGEPGGSIEHILLTRNVGYISLATFLVQPLFEEFLNGIKPFSTKAYSNICRFYGAMDEFVSRRDFSSIRQNKLIHEFIWSLGIEALTEQHIFALTQYERIMAVSDDPILYYAYVLTHPSEMIKELGMHRLEANAVLVEIARRKHELFDIFFHYCNNKTDVTQCFNRLM